MSIETHGNLSKDDVLHYAPALDQASKHPIAQAIVVAARPNGAALPILGDVVETPGEGVTGTIDGRKVVVGGAAFVAAQAGIGAPDSAVIAAGSVVVSLAVDGKLMGHIVMADALRTGTAVVSAITFAAGAVIPLIVASVAPAAQISAVVAGTTLIGLMALGGLGTSVGGAGIIKGAVRVTFWGALTMAATAVVGIIFGVAA